MNTGLLEVYKKAHELHIESFQQIAQRRWYRRPRKFDDSHLPEGYNNPEKWDQINQKLRNSVQPENLMPEGNFKCVLSFEEALILLIKYNHDNIHYRHTWVIDLHNYKLGAEVFTIFVK